MAGGAHKDPNAERLQAAADKLAKQAKAKPRDKALRSKVADAYFEAGQAFEYSKAGLTPHMMYATALHDYNIAVSYNPHLARAAAEKKQIEDIYRSMGRPIPK